MEQADTPTRNTFDLIVIGGGCNGTGIARDAALRGIHTLLLEKNDFAMGATGASSRMIHGGARYLLYDRGTTHLSCIDSGYIQKIAPHLLFRIPFLIPYMERKRGNWPMRFFMNRIYPLLMEAYFRGYDQFQPHKNGKPYTRLNRQELLALEPGITPDALGALSLDEWGIDPWRLCTLNALDAHRHGATILTATRVTGFLRDGDTITGVATRDEITGVRREYRAKVVMNATGAWSPDIAKMADAQVALRPGKGTHLVLDRRISNWCVSANAVDGRQIIVWPDQNTTLVGTTDDDYYGNPDNAFPTQDEIKYLFQGIERIFPAIKGAQVIRSFSGVRPTIFAWNAQEEDLSRHHKIFDHSKSTAHRQDLTKTKGFLSIAGGKLATYRLMSEEATDVIAKKLNNNTPCKTHSQPLPGGGFEEQPDQVAIAAEYAQDPYTIARLVFRHGKTASTILQDGKAQGSNTIVCECESVLASEVEYVIAHEFVRKPSDICRRTRLGLGPCNGLQCARMAARIFASCNSEQHFSLEDAYRDIKQSIWEQQAPALQGNRLRQVQLERLLLAHKPDTGDQ